MKKIILIILFLTIVLPSNTGLAKKRLDKDLIKLSNTVMMDIFDQMLKQKEGYPELSGFDKGSLKKNSFGVYALEYWYTDQQGFFKDNPYRFGLTILPDDEAPEFSGNIVNPFNYSFPLLNLKFSGYQSELLLTKQFDINDIMQYYGRKIWDKQQEQMPYQIALKPVKDTYYVGEEIIFDVVLKNNTERNLWFKELSNKTLFFVYNNQIWGTRPEDSPHKVKRFVLKGNTSYTKRFMGESFSVPKRFEIFCTYDITYQGIKPTGRLIINVVNPPPKASKINNP
ncbi:MAG: hypothetical protein KC713_03400 [Candidatus Omnitrophica bacterium]|nr:hypothetical protein [Candidatus Omnitrophota bacterium]